MNMPHLSPLLWMLATPMMILTLIILIIINSSMDKKFFIKMLF